MQVKSIAECSKGSILQYYRPSLSYHFPLRPLFCLFISSCLNTGFAVLSLNLLYHVYIESSECVSITFIFFLPEDSSRHMNMTSSSAFSSQSENLTTQVSIISLLTLCMQGNIL